MRPLSSPLSPLTGGAQSLTQTLRLLVVLAALLAAPVQSVAQSRAAQLFEFHSSFWVNLHQVLLNEALRSADKPDRRVQSTPELVAARLGSSGAGKGELDAWNAAVRFYRTRFQSREQFDDELVSINDTLSAEPDDGAAPLRRAGLPAELVAVLDAAAPVYRKYGWPAHDQSNRAWIASQAPRLRTLGPAFAAALAKDLHQPWPAMPIRVDVCFLVVALGHAYTVLPPHTTLSSSDAALQGLSGFELLHHEALHAIADTLSAALRDECQAQHKDCADLWHAVLFYTSGFELRRLLPAADQEGFMPYADRQGVYTRGAWPRYLPLLEKDWAAYLEGKTSFGTGVHALVADLPAP